MLVGWPDGGPGQYHVIGTRPRPGRGPARYMQVVEFYGPRSEEWAAAEERAADGRLGPATDGVDGIVSVLRLRAADNAYLVIVLAESMDAFDVASQGARVPGPPAGRGLAFSPAHPAVAGPSRKLMIAASNCGAARAVP